MINDPTGFAVPEGQLSEVDLPASALSVTTPANIGASSSDAK
jgi:hypothetical protein